MATTLACAIVDKREMTGSQIASQQGKYSPVSQPTRNTDNRPAFPLVKAYVEPPAGIEPATPSLPSMVGPFGGQRDTSLRSIELQVAGRIDDREMGCCEAVCGTAAGQITGTQPGRDAQWSPAARDSNQPPDPCLVLYVVLVGSRRICPAHVGGLVDLVGLQTGPVGSSG